jgi:hypothetical protein
MKKTNLIIPYFIIISYAVILGLALAESSEIVDRISILIMGFGLGYLIVAITKYSFREQKKIQQSQYSQIYSAIIEYLHNNKKLTSPFITQYYISSITYKKSNKG